MIDDKAANNAETRLILNAKFDRGRKLNIFPAMQKIGYPEGCAMPKFTAASTSSPQSPIKTTGHSVDRYTDNDTANSDTPPTQVGGFLKTLKAAKQPLDQRSNLLWNPLLRGICFVFCTLSSPDKSLVFSECLQNNYPAWILLSKQVFYKYLVPAMRTQNLNQVLTLDIIFLRLFSGGFRLGSR